MADLTMFTSNHLQAAKTVLRVLSDAGIMDIDAAVKSIKAALPNPPNVTGRTGRRKSCPQCGKRMFPLASIDGLNRIGCVCRYSEVVK